MGLFKQSWMGKNEEKALKEIDKITDPAILFYIPKYTPLETVRSEAVQKAMREREAQVEIARSIIQSEDNSPLQTGMLKKISNRDILFFINRRANNAAVRDAANLMSIKKGEQISNFLYKNAFPLGQPKKEIIRHIMCICYDMPSINELKPTIQSAIMEKETAEGSEILPTSRITFDSFSDNAMLRDESQHIQLIKHHLVQEGYHHDEEVDYLIHGFRHKGTIQHQNAQPFLATYYVLYYG